MNSFGCLYIVIYATAGALLVPFLAGLVLYVRELRRTLKPNSNTKQGKSMIPSKKDLIM